MIGKLSLFSIKDIFIYNNLTLTFHIPCTVSQYCFRYSLLLSLVYTPFLRLKELNKTSVVKYKCHNATEHSSTVIPVIQCLRMHNFCIKLSQHCMTTSSVVRFKSIIKKQWFENEQCGYTVYCSYLTCLAGTVIVMFDFPLSCTTYLYWSAFKATGFDLELLW